MNLEALYLVARAPMTLALGGEFLVILCAGHLLNLGNLPITLCSYLLAQRSELAIHSLNID